MKKYAIYYTENGERYLFKETDSLYYVEETVKCANSAIQCGYLDKVEVEERY